MELLSKGTKLQYATSKTGTFSTLYGLQSTPDMGGDPEKVDITNLADGARRYIPGVKDYGDLDFTFFYNDDTENPAASADDVADAYATLRSLQLANTTIWLKLIYPDDTGYLWSSKVAVKRSAAEVNAPLQFVLRSTPLTELEDVTPTV